MKIAVALILSFCLLVGCDAGSDEIDQAMDLRKRILEAENCTFQATITADYGENIYNFKMNCTVDSNGTLYFTVSDPSTIAGISGKISTDQASLTYEDKVLIFPKLAEGELTPVSAPWIFINTLRCGYLTGCSKEDNGLCLYIDDSFEDNPLHLQIKIDDAANPITAEIFWKDRRILSIDIRNFTLQ